MSSHGNLNAMADALAAASAADGDGGPGKSSPGSLGSFVRMAESSSRHADSNAPLWNEVVAVKPRTVEVERDDGIRAVFYVRYPNESEEGLAAARKLAAAAEAKRLGDEPVLMMECGNNNGTNKTKKPIMVPSLLVPQTRVMKLMKCFRLITVAIVEVEASQMRVWTLNLKLCLPG